MPGLLNIGTSRQDFSGVVENSQTSLFWQVNRPEVEIPVEEIATNFYVSTSSGKMQEILKPIVTVNPPTAFTVTLSGNMRDGGVVSGSPQHFTVNYICDRVSTGTVIITIKMPNAKTVEYSYIKQCSSYFYHYVHNYIQYINLFLILEALKRHTDQVWTANQLLFTL